MIDTTGNVETINQSMAMLKTQIEEKNELIEKLKEEAECLTDQKDIQIQMRKNFEAFVQENILHKISQSKAEYQDRLKDLDNSKSK